MANTGCTNTNLTVNVVGYLPGTGSTVGNIVTFRTPTPVWSEAELTGPYISLKKVLMNLLWITLTQ